MVYTTLQLIISKEEAMENILMCKAEKEKQLVPDTINNGRDRHRTKNYAAFSTSNFPVFGAVGIIDDNASFGIDAGENNEMSTISKISGQHGADHRGG